MTGKLIVYGDSTYDTGNLNFILANPSLSGLPQPVPAFDEPVYANGGFKKASNGYTLLEGLLLGLGVQDIPNGTLLDLESIDIAADGINPSLPITNFSIAAASSGRNGVATSSGVDFSNTPIGLLSQINSSLGYISSLKAFQPSIDIDVAISIGNNDIAAIAQGSNLAATLSALSTPSKKDDKAIVNSIVNTIVDNITGAVLLLKQAGVNEITILGPQLVGETPFAKSLSSLYAVDFSGFVNDIASEANKQLDKVFKSKPRNSRSSACAPNKPLQDGSVFYVDGAKLTADYFALTPPMFVDAIHLDSTSAQGLGASMASLIQQQSGFQSFGFG